LAIVVIETFLELGFWKLELCVSARYQIFTRLSAGRTIGELSGTLKAR
jgi:hypothetical protein